MSARQRTLWIRRLLIFLVVVLLLAPTHPALAEAEARMAGSVTMPDGSPAAGVTIRLEAADEKGATVVANSNKKGRYLIGLIRPGAYVLRVETHGDTVLLRAQGKALEADAGRAVLWEMDREISAEQPVKLNVGPRHQIELDIVVGTRSTNAPVPRETDTHASQDSFNAAFTRVRAGDFNGALELLEPLAEKTPDHANTWYLIGFSRERLGKFDTALVAADRAASLDPALVGLHALRGRILKGLARFPEAEAELRKEIAQSTEKSVVADSWIVLGVIFKETNRPKEAIEALENAVAADPSQQDVFVELARLYSSAGDLEKATTALAGAEKAGGGDDASLLNLAIGFLNEKQHDRAEAIARRLVEKGSADGNLAIAHSVLARCALNHGKTAEGVTHLEKALALDPTSKLAAENRTILAAIKK